MVKILFGKKLKKEDYINSAMISNFFTTQSCFGFERVKKAYNVLRESLIYIFERITREKRESCMSIAIPFMFFSEFKQIFERSLYDVSS